MPPSTLVTRAPLILLGALLLAPSSARAADIDSLSGTRSGDEGDAFS